MENSFEQTQFEFILRHFLLSCRTRIECPCIQNQSDTVKLLTWLPIALNNNVIISILVVSNIHVLDTKTEHFQDFALLHPSSRLVITVIS
jgi:hypothetical protein